MMRPRPILLNKTMLLAMAVWMAFAPSALAFLKPDEREALDLSEFVVTDPNASYFDVVERSNLLEKTSDPELGEMDNQLEITSSCRHYLAKPVIRQNMSLPSFYDSPENWEVAAGSNFAFEDAASKLAGAYVATHDPYYAKCLASFLDKWAKADALETFQFSLYNPQAWYGIESMIFSAGLGYSVIRGESAIQEDQRQRIEEWLTTIAENHYAIDGVEPSCCNNHFFRRSLYMTIIGVVTNSDEMFQTGLKAVYSALHDMNKDGSFNLSMQRGRRAIHYHNYSLIYLTMIMQIAKRQGYDFFDRELYGHRMTEAVDFLFRGLADPTIVAEYSDPEQDLEFTEDPQYFSWMEVWLDHHQDTRMEQFVQPYRPIYNRSAGGYVTYYFKDPEPLASFVDRQLARIESDRLTPAEIGGRYPKLELWRRTQ